MKPGANELDERVRTILASSRIRGRIVILCEGDVSPLQGRPSPQEYRKLEGMPDACFYKACVPQWWHDLHPAFFNCGGRGDVIDTFFRLRELHDEDPSSSYLSPDKLFALVDLDIQSHPIRDYEHASTEDIFKDLYHEGNVARANAASHRIWVTGLVHKEAYFLLSPMQAVFDEHIVTPFFGQTPVILSDLYPIMADELKDDADLATNYASVQHRSSFHLPFSCDTLAEWSQRWSSAHAQSTGEEDRERLAHLVLLYAKSKRYWQRITPDPGAGYTSEPRTYREQLALAVGRALARLERGTRHHIGDFFDTLHRHRTAREAS